MSLSVSLSTYTSLEPLSRMCFGPPRTGVGRCKRSPFRSALGEAFTAWRLALDWTLLDVASAVGCHVLTVRSWGRKVTPQRQYWPKLRRLGFNPEPYASPSRSDYVPRAKRDAFGASLSSWRLSRGWSQMDLACELGVTEGTVQHWERGRSMPRERWLKALTLLGFRMQEAA